MFFLRDKKPRFKPQSGFTLLELLVVITVLGLIAGAAVLGLNGVTDQSRADATNFEMAELRKALLQFRRDSGSRNFPKQGVYNCTTIPTANFPAEAGATNAEQIVWCQHPANFWMLFQDPLANGWNADTKRGWNGPYIQRKSGYLDIGDDLTPDASGSPITGVPITKVWGIADPNIKPFVTEILDGDEHLAWRTTTTQAQPYEKYGRPYLLFGMDTSTATGDDRLVSMGDNGKYDGVGSEVCVPPLDPDTSEALDTVLCLLR